MLPIPNAGHLSASSMLFIQKLRNQKKKGPLRSLLSVGTLTIIYIAKTFVLEENFYRAGSHFEFWFVILTIVLLLAAIGSAMSTEAKDADGQRRGRILIVVATGGIMGAAVCINRCLRLAWDSAAIFSDQALILEKFDQEAGRLPVSGGSVFPASWLHDVIIDSDEYLEEYSPDLRSLFLPSKDFQWDMKSLIYRPSPLFSSAELEWLRLGGALIPPDVVTAFTACALTVVAAVGWRRIRGELGGPIRFGNVLVVVTLSVALSLTLFDHSETATTAFYRSDEGSWSRGTFQTEFSPYLDALGVLSFPGPLKFPDEISHHQLGSLCIRAPWNIASLPAMWLPILTLRVCVLVGLAVAAFAATEDLRLAGACGAIAVTLFAGLVASSLPERFLYGSAGFEVPSVTSVVPLAAERKLSDMNTVFDSEFSHPNWFWRYQGREVVGLLVCAREIVRRVGLSDVSTYVRAFHLCGSDRRTVVLSMDQWDTTVFLFVIPGFLSALAFAIRCRDKCCTVRMQRENRELFESPIADCDDNNINDNNLKDLEVSPGGPHWPQF